MKKLTLLVGLLIWVALPVCAQDDAVKLELASGFAYGNFNLGTPTIPTISGLLPVPLGRENTFGYLTSLTFYPRKNFGLTADFGGQFGDIRTVFGPIEYATNQVLGGPHLVLFRGEKYSGFAHGMVGLNNFRSRIPGLGGTNLAFGFGGGLDLAIGDNSALRLFQADYIPMRESGVWRHNIRVGFAVVIKISGNQ